MKRSTSAIILVIVIFFIFVFLNFIFLVDTREDEETESDGDRSSYRSTSYGTLAFYTLLEESDYPVIRFEAPLTQLNERGHIGTLIIVAPPAQYGLKNDELASLIDWVEAGGLLIIIDREIFISLGDLKIMTTSAIARSNAKPLQPTPYTIGVRRVALSQYATRVIIDGRLVTAHIGDDQGAVLADARLGSGRVVVLTEPYVIANNGIAQADNLNLALNLLHDRPKGLIAFDEYHHGHGAYPSLARTPEGIIAYFRGTPIPWMMVQAGLMLVLIIYTRGRRFARPLPLKREPRTTNLEFISSMANIIRLARATDLAMENIYSEFRRRLCQYSGQPTTVETGRLASAVSRRAKLKERDLSLLLTRCELIARGKAVSDSELLDLVARIRDLESRLRI
jgi:hypothetical protein